MLSKAEVSKEGKGSHVVVLPRAFIFSLIQCRNAKKDEIDLFYCFANIDKISYIFMSGSEIL
jgi:hypothetical protein